MADHSLEVGDRLHAMYTDCSCWEYYPAEVVAVATGKKRAKAPIKVSYFGYPGDDAWLPLESLKSKKIPKTVETVKGKAKATAKEPIQYDYSGLAKGMRLQVEADGTWYAAEVVTVATSKQRAKAPVKVNYAGYTASSDEWVGGLRIRSKALVKQGETVRRVPRASTIALMAPGCLMNGCMLWTPGPTGYYKGEYNCDKCKKDSMAGPHWHCEKHFTDFCADCEAAPEWKEAPKTDRSVHPRASTIALMAPGCMLNGCMKWVKDTGYYKGEFDCDKCHKTGLTGPHWHCSKHHTDFCKDCQAQK